MKSLAGILRITDRRPQGPFPTFQRAHLFLAFLTIGEKGAMGRQALASSTGLGEGAIRTVIKRPREEGYADVSASGCHLTTAGRRVYNSTTRRLSPFAALEGSDLTMGASQVAVAVRNGGPVRTGIEQRDSAIRVGALGATTYVIRAGKFTIPGGSSDCEHDFPSDAWGLLRTQLKPTEGDSVILCGSDDEPTARLGAISAAITLL